MDDARASQSQPEPPNRIGYNRKPMLRDVLENDCSGKEDLEAATGGVFL